MSDLNNTAVSAGWGKPKESIVLELPSGNGKVRIKDLEIPDLVRLGVLDVLDTFTKKVLPKEPGKKKKTQDQSVADRIMQNPDQLTGMLEVIDKVIAEAIIEPKVSLRVPIEGAEGQYEPLDEDKIYAHLVPFEDKMEVFSRSTGSMEEYFRAGGEQTADVGAVEESEGVQRNTE